MSKANRERAKAGTIFRDGRLVNASVHNEAVVNARTLSKFMDVRRLKYDAKKYHEPTCPKCKGDKVFMAMRRPGQFELLCKKCFHTWEYIPEKEEKVDSS